MGGVGVVGTASPLAPPPPVDIRKAVKPVAEERQREATTGDRREVVAGV